MGASKTSKNRLNSKNSQMAKKEKDLIAGGNESLLKAEKKEPQFDYLTL